MSGVSRARLFSAAGTAAVLAALLALNTLSQRAHARLDFSAGRVYSLSPGTKALLNGLKDTLVVKVYFSPRLPPPFSLNERFLRDLLSEYRGAARGRLTLEFLDPDNDEAARRQAREAGIMPVQINLMGRDRFESKEAWMGAVLLYEGKSEALPVLERAQDLEYELTRRIKRLMSSERKAVGFVSGHGEKSPDDAQLEPFFALVRERLDARAVSLAEPLPPDLDALWLAGPAARLKPEEVAALKAWAAKGKPLVVLANQRLADLARFQSSPLDAGLAPLLSEWGLSLGDGFVVDAQSEKIQLNTRVGRFSAARVVDYPFVPMATRLDDGHPVTAGLQVVTFPFAQPVRFDAGKATGVSYTSLAESSRASWLCETADIAPGQDFKPLTRGTRGPFSLAGVAQGPAGRLLVVGTAYQMDARLGNKAASLAFILNALDWSAQDEDLLAIRGKGAAARPLRPLSDASRAALKYLMLLMLPCATLSAAGAASYRRRRRLRALASLYADV